MRYLVEVILYADRGDEDTAKMGEVLDSKTKTFTDAQDALRLFGDLAGEIDALDSSK